MFFFYLDLCWWTFIELGFFFNEQTFNMMRHSLDLWILLQIIILLTLIKVHRKFILIKGKLKF